jgi:hypothetical protein
MVRLTSDIIQSINNSQIKIQIKTTVAILFLDLKLTLTDTLNY